MTAAVLDLLPLYAMDLLDPDEVSAIETALAASPQLRGELAALRDGGHALAEALEPVAPDPALRLRLLTSIVTPAPGGLADRIAALFDLAVDRARALLAWPGEPARWVTMAPGIEMAAVVPGPAHAGAQCGLLRVAPGARFPWHSHQGEEVALVMAGGARMADGREIVPGDVVVADESVEHDFVVDHDEACVFAVRAHGIRFTGPSTRAR